ncbi:bifunctional riboflavin kinase/FAD synthetase [Gehongia tenuis]|uniref:Riboflavin biosynthesis protein n=1 Tax=Gehongia tenuis TaxID=2763655 RepID=A0A926D4C6_9FIRM|nr:bifunctional riboflavin kinase/FAD synthetase [Gehongia tenuis]MBC8531118.1 bifunctional riboflavin kinase/FAD synthetase [Gehongia tenuis]
MKVYFGHPDPSMQQRFGLALGFFDGVHEGHRRLITCLKLAAAKQKFIPAVYTFLEHPTHVVPGLIPRKLLTTPRERIHFLKEEGIESLYMGSFTPEFAAEDKQTFMEQLFVPALKYLVVGYNYSFGRGGEGTAEDLRSFGEARGVPVVVLPEVAVNGESVSSTRIRKLVEKGELREAVMLLRRPYSVEGSVKPGNQIGQTMGFPTANLYLPDYKVLPARGVYATIAYLDGRHWAAVTNVGIKPTVTDKAVDTVETHIMGKKEVLYGRFLRVMFVQKLRGEIKFDGLDTLKKQIAMDVEAAKEILKPMAEE